MADLKQFEFCLLRYVPNVVRGEFVNVGLLLFEPQPNGFGFADVRYDQRLALRATCLDRQVDIEVLRGSRGRRSHAIAAPAGCWLAAA